MKLTKLKIGGRTPLVFEKDKYNPIPKVSPSLDSQIIEVMIKAIAFGKEQNAGGFRIWFKNKYTLTCKKDINK